MVVLRCEQELATRRLWLDLQSREGRGGRQSSIREL